MVCRAGLTSRARVADNQGYGYTISSVWGKTDKSKLFYPYNVGPELVTDQDSDVVEEQDESAELQVERTLSVDEIYEKAEGYDLVFTAEASLADALNNRLEKPVLGHFATTPMIYVLSSYQNQELLQERGLFLKAVQETSLTWKQASYLLENILDCWKEEGASESILKYDRFDNETTREVLEVVKNTNNVFRRMQEFEVDQDKNVAVVNLHQFNELDRQVLPEEFDEFSVFTGQEEELPELKIYNSTAEIIRAVQQNISEENAQDIAVVTDRDSSYATLIESALQSKGIPTMVQDGLSDDEDLRTFIRLLRLSLSRKRLLVKDCQPVLKRLGKNTSIELNNDYLEDVDRESLDEFKALLDDIQGATLEEALKEFQQRVDTDLEEHLDDLGILEEEVSEEAVNRLEYYLDTYDVKKDSTGHGVLLADAKSSAYVDRPIVFYLGMDSGWTSSVSDKPWTDNESNEETDLKDFKVLIQNGEQQHFLVQDQLMNEDVTPCLYFNELTDEDFESFRDLENTYYEADSTSPTEGFEKEDYDVEADKVQLFSQSALNSFVKCPKDYLFDRLSDSPDQDYFRKGTLFHDFAEFYVNHKDFVEDQGREEFVQIMVEEMKSIVDDLQLNLLHTELKVGVKNIINFIEREELENKVELDGYKQKDKDNFFANYFDKNLEKNITEAWFENKELGVKGIADLIMSENQIADYKSGKRKTASKIIRNSNLELLDDSPNFQAMLYLAQLREANPGEELQFTFFHFLDNIDDEISGEASLEDNIVAISYYPREFNNQVKEEEVFEYITADVAESNDRRKTLEKLGYEEYRDFFENREIEEQYDKDAIKETELAEEFINYCKNKVGDYKYVEKGCLSALKQIVYFRKENYFKEDIDAFEDFMQKQLDHLNRFKKESFPVQNPELDIEVDGDDFDHKDMIAQ